MENLLFYALLIALVYYFLYHYRVANSGEPFNKGLPPEQKSHTNLTRPSTSTQYEPGPDETVQFPSATVIPDPDTIKDLTEKNQALLNEISSKNKEQQQKERTITNLNKQLEQSKQTSSRQIQQQNQQIQDLKKQFNELAQTQRKNETVLKSEQQDLEKTLDQMINDMVKLTNDF
jgi:predicted RNase H-like nuclease (RuvC/YqgF family)